ncbi:hypothetical protein [Ornithinibacillus bavariensis]|nr:hypothetical protein [Ornithinibacillus bavariensis]
MSVIKDEHLLVEGGEVRLTVVDTIMKKSIMVRIRGCNMSL